MLGYLFGEHRQGRVMMRTGGVVSKLSRDDSKDQNAANINRYHHGRFGATIIVILVL